MSTSATRYIDLRQVDQHVVRKGPVESCVEVRVLSLIRKGQQLKGDGNIYTASWLLGGCSTLAMTHPTQSVNQIVSDA